MRVLTSLFVLGCIGVMAGGADRAEAQTRTITCESQGDQRHLCPVPNLNEGSVRVTRKLSQSACVEGRSWGAVNNNIWVSNGCRAEFTFTAAFTGGNQNAGGNVRIIKCASEDDKRHLCPIQNLNEGSVRVVNKLSQSACIKGQSWGTIADNIWVSRGCRAEFAYARN